MDAPCDRRILVVDDDPMSREILVERLGAAGYGIDTAVDGLDGWEHLSVDPKRYYLVLLDRQMPRLDGMGLIRRIKGSDPLARIPVIFQTAAGDSEQIREGIEAGCFYYLVKPYDGGILLATVRAAIGDFMRHEAFRSEVRRGIHGLSSLRNASFEFRTLAEATSLATLLAYAFPDPESQVVGISELLINAVEHGNLGISYEDKSVLLTNGTWEAEIQRRLDLDEHRDKLVRVEFEREDHEVKLRIRDSGSGFDWERFLEIDPRRAFDTHGRGIAMAKAMSFSRLQYCGCGNEVVATVEIPVEN